MTVLHAGAKAPAFTLKDAAGETVRLADFKGRNLLVYFFPKADTPGCTLQACAVRDAALELRQADLATVGISPDTPAAQAAFDGKYQLNFPLLADTDHTVAEAYGVWREKTLYGRKTMGILRSSFLIDEHGIIKDLWYKVTPEDTVPKALAALSR